MINGKQKFMIMQRQFSTHIKVPQKVMMNIRRRVNRNKVKLLIRKVRLFRKGRKKLKHWKKKKVRVRFHLVINLKKTIKIILITALNRKTSNFLTNWQIFNLKS